MRSAIEIVLFFMALKATLAVTPKAVALQFPEGVIASCREGGAAWGVRGVMTNGENCGRWLSDRSTGQESKQVFLP
jgi:hypothetical protein